MTSSCPLSPGTRRRGGRSPHPAAPSPARPPPRALPEGRGPRGGRTQGDERQDPGGFLGGTRRETRRGEAPRGWRPRPRSAIPERKAEAGKGWRLRGSSFNASSCIASPPQRLCFKLTRSHRCWLAEPGAPRASLGRLAAGGRFAGAAHGASQKPKQGPDPFSPHAHLSHAPWCCRGELQAEAGPAPLSDTPLPTFPAATSSPNHNVAPATVVPNPRPPRLDPRPPRQQKAPAVASRPLLPSPTRPPPPPAPPQARPPFPGCPLLSQLAVTAAEMADD